MSLVLPFLGLLLALTADDVAFQNEELLHLPRAHGVVLSLLPDESCELQVEYGLFPHQTRRTELISVRAGELALFDLNGLTGSERYQYQVSVRRPGELGWMLRDLHGFSTLKEPGQRVRFDYVLSSPDPSVDGSVLLSYTVGGR